MVNRSCVQDNVAMSYKSKAAIRLVTIISTAVAYAIFCLLISAFVAVRIMCAQYGDDDSAALGMVFLLYLIFMVPICTFWGGSTCQSSFEDRQSRTEFGS